MKSWFLIQCKPNSHFLAKKNLERQRFVTFLPLLNSTKRTSRHFFNSQQPLFPGYLFISVDPEKAAWRTINGTVGVRRVVSFGHLPEPVPSTLIISLMERCDEEGKIKYFKTLKPGQDVEVLSGPFAKFSAIVEKIEEKERLWILLNMMGQAMRIQLRTDQVVNSCYN